MFLKNFIWTITAPPLPLLTSFRADLDKDGSLSNSEMEAWVAQKMKEHFAEAEEENEHIFKHLDPDGKDTVTIVSWHGLFHICSLENTNIL